MSNIVIKDRTLLYNCYMCGMCGQGYLHKYHCPIADIGMKFQKTSRKDICMILLYRPKTKNAVKVLQRTGDNKDELRGFCGNRITFLMLQSQDGTKTK